MAVASSSNARSKYDVFLSFSGEDTREGFTNTLYDVLKGKGIDTFIDDGLPRGKQIEASLRRSIEESMIAVVVFSNKYASSSWCLDELLKIVECCQVVLPIFYKVDPFHVQKQLGMFGDEFAKLKRTESKTKIKKWSDALSFVATKSGWDLANYRTEINLIKEVAAWILKKLDSVSLSIASPNFIGIASVVDDIRKLLNNESSSVQFLGVWGMGGLGKTTIVDVLYHQLSKQFDSCYFATNIRHESSNRLVTLRNKIISKILGENFTEGTPNIEDFVISRLQKQVVFIVLDNVSTSNQVTTLVGTKKHSWFAPGSKVIVTSRDASVFKPEDMTVFEIKEMSPHYSLRLFCLNAFKQNQPLEGFVDLSQQIVNYAKGVPLALKVLGSLLYKRKMDEWVSTLGKLRGSLDMEIEEVLKTSYYDLDREEKAIFLDVACFFKGDDKYRVKNILDGCGFSTSIVITRLIEKCLITLSEDNKLGMHDLLQKMGWEIAGQEVSQEFGIRSRFWTPNDSYNMLTSFAEAKAIEGIFLDIDKVKKLNINPMTFSRMQNLRLLKFEQSQFSFDGLHELKVSSDIQFLPNNLRFLYWDRYPCEHLPSSFSAENLVELNLHNSKLKQLWDRVKYPLKLERLKVLDLRGSEFLTELPDLASATNLEKIILDECVDLVEIPVSIQQLQSLSFLSLRGCISLHSLPSLVNLKALGTLDLYKCSSFKEFPEIPADIEVLNLEDTIVVLWPQSMSFLNNLKVLCVTTKLQSLPSTMYLNSLKTLTLSHCDELQEFPKIIGSTQRLDLGCTRIRELPSSIVLLDSLVELDLRFCEELERLPINFCQLKRLEKLNLCYCSKLFERPFTLLGLTFIKELHLKGCKLQEIPSWLSTLRSLQVLDLSWNCFVRVPKSIKQLSLLEVINFRDCQRLKSLPELPSQVNDLNLAHCRSLKVASSSFIANGGQKQSQATSFNLPVHRFNFAGCNGLSKVARRNIVTNALIRIQNIANSRNENVKFPSRVSLPGSEIPDCFHQCKGSSIVVELPVNWCTSLFMGFIFGVIAVRDKISALEVWHDNCITYRCEFKDRDGYNLGSYWASFKFDEEMLSSFGSDLLVLQYSGDGYSTKEGNYKDATHAFFNFEAEVIKVVNCGVHLVYAQVEDQNNAGTVETVSVETTRKQDFINETRLGMARQQIIKPLCKLAKCFGYKHKGPVS